MPAFTDLTFAFFCRKNIEENFLLSTYYSSNFKNLFQNSSDLQSS